MQEKEKSRKEQQRSNYDAHHRTRELSSLAPGDHVWITDQQTDGTVIQMLTPRSYQVETDTGTLSKLKTLESLTKNSS